MVELLTFLHINQIFFILHAVFVIRGFWYFLKLQYQKIICWAKNVIKESGRGFQYCQMFFIHVRTIKKVVLNKQRKKSYPNLAYGWCNLQVFELSCTSRFSSFLFTKFSVFKIGIIMSSSKISWAVLLSTSTKNYWNYCRVTKIWTE